MISIVAGAVMYWAVTSQGHGFRLSTVGSSSWLLAWSAGSIQPSSSPRPVDRSAVGIAHTTSKLSTRQVARLRFTRKSTNRLASQDQDLLAASVPLGTVDE